MDNYKRREFVKLSAIGFAGIALQFNALSTYAQRANAHLGKWGAKTELNWDAFLEHISELAKTQHDLHWNQKRYTRQVKRLLNHCNFPEFENVKEVFENYEDKRENWFEAERLHHEIDFQVYLFQFEKGEYIPPHDHPNMTGVLNVVSGNLLARNFDFIMDLAEIREVTYETGYKVKLQKCVIKEVDNEILTAGDVGILTANEGNIRRIMPNEFTQMVDVFTPAYQEDTKANWFNVNEEEFYQEQKKSYEAEYSIH